LLLAACQKESSLENLNSGPGGGPSNPNQGSLRRLVTVAGGDSTAVDLSYDASNRLTLYNVTSTDPDENAYVRVTRNSAGIITRYVSNNEGLLSQGIDSLVTNLFYNTAQSRYTYGLSAYTESGTTYFDSTAYAYNGAGNMTAKTSYLRVGPSPYVPYQKSEYTYAGGNVLSEKYYFINANTSSYTYDDKVNPLKLGVEALILIDDVMYFGNNNASAVSFVDATDPANTVAVNIAYNYNSANKPAGGTATQVGSSGTYSLRYYYN
jgi:hypothetical protein